MAVTPVTSQCRSSGIKHLLPFITIIPPLHAHLHLFSEMATCPITRFPCLAQVLFGISPPASRVTHSDPWMSLQTGGAAVRTPCRCNSNNARTLE